MKTEYFDYFQYHTMVATEHCRVECSDIQYLKWIYVTISHYVGHCRLLVSTVSKYIFVLMFVLIERFYD